MARPSKRQEQSARTRERLIEAAGALFAERGYRGASVQSIAQRAGISRGSIFWHFGSKEGLLFAVAEGLFAHWEREVLVPAVGGATGFEAVRRSLEAHREFLESDPETIRLFHVLMSEAMGPRPELAGAFARFHAHFKALGAEWVGGPEADAIAVAVIGALGGIAYQYLLDPHAIDLARVYPALTEALQHGLAK